MHTVTSSRRAQLTALLFSAAAALAAAPILAADPPNLSDASGLSATAGASGLSAGGGDISVIVGKFIGAILGLLGVVFVVLIIYSGFLWMTAQGNDDKVKKAKQTLSSAVIGIVLTFSAYAITTFVISSLKTSLDASADPDPHLEVRQ